MMAWEMEKVIILTECCLMGDICFPLFLCALFVLPLKGNEWVSERSRIEATRRLYP
jgi:hypothetical protein